MKRLILTAAIASLLMPAAALAAKNGTSKTDADGNGYADAGVVVTKHWTSLYAYDASDDWYWDLGDGRVYGTVGSVADLDSATLSRCDYSNNSRGSFDNTPYQDTGWISNSITCRGYDGHGHWTYLMVHDDDPRFSGDAARSDALGWGPSWEYKILTESGSGNLFKPASHQG